MAENRESRIKGFIMNDLWIMLLDIVAVNASYFLALVLRFYVNNIFRETVHYFIDEFFVIAPYYTAIAIIVFILFRLYGGMWRYAGINDLNRIIFANLCTSAIMVIGTLLFHRRMPKTYYVIGGFLQLLFVACVRFVYRIVIVERQKLSKKQADALIVGCGEEAHYVIRLLDSGVTYRPLCIVDTSSNGRLMDGLPVYTNLEDALKRHDGVKCVFIASSNIGTEEKEKIHLFCDKNQLTIRDYSSFFSFANEGDSFSSMNDVVKGPEKGDRSIPFSPPDIGDSEIGEVVQGQNC